MDVTPENTAVFRQNLLDILTSYMDLLYSRILIAERQTIVPVIALHAISHILKWVNFYRFS